MEQTTLHVTGMHCGACEQRIQKALSRLEGVKRSSADHRKQEVRVAFDPAQTSLAAIRAVIERADYRVEGVVGGAAGAAPAGASA